MTSSTFPPFRPFLFAALVLLLAGSSMLAFTILFLEPTVWGRWLFFFSGTMSLMGFALPIVWFLNLRFPTQPPAGTLTLLRQAAWFGVYGGLLAWLQQERLVSFGLAAGLGIGMITIEYLLRLREQAIWRPPVVEEDLSAEGTVVDEPSE
ncbi:MAG: hypothetical protein N2049_10850 [Anaerolineales bacterium]|nr:hypothetical protein [Anaerolineales bacterium]